MIPALICAGILKCGDQIRPRNRQFIQNNFPQELKHLETFPSAFRDDSEQPGIQTPLAPIVHPKLNTGKELFKCGMGSAECAPI
jgi:hypothetical protein